jgi:DNA-binding transcriptional ArsR family regulator
MTTSGELWLDREAGPVVRPYALTAGRTRPPGEGLGLIDVVTAVGEPRADARELEPEHWRLVELCRTPATVADLASQIDLPLGVVRILLSDLREKELVSIVRAPRRDSAQESVLRSLLEGLRAL